MPFEKNVGNLANLRNIDFFRAITAEGASKKVSGEIVKAFIGADTITKVNDYYYFQDASSPAVNDYRLYSNIVYLDFERYSGSTWERQFRIGGSGVISASIEIIKDAASADLFVNDEGNIRNLIRSASFSDGTVAGDLGGDFFLTGLNKITSALQSVGFIWAPVQIDETQQFTGKEFYVNLTTTPGDGFITRKIKFSTVDIPEDNKVQIKVFLQSDLVNPLWQNVTDIELDTGVGSIIDPTTGELTLSPSFFGVELTDLRVTVTSRDDITLKGSNNLGTDIYFQTFDSDVEFRTMLGYQPWKTNITYSLEEKIIEDNEVYFCNTAGLQTGTFQENIANWDIFKAIPYISVLRTTDDKGLNITEQLSVGTPENPRETVLGSGDSYPIPLGLHCNTANTVGMTVTSAIDVTTILESDSESSTGLFDGTTTGKYILVGSDYKFSGVKVKMESVGVIEPNNVKAEYLRTTDTWIKSYYMSTDANYPYDQHGSQLAACSSCSEQWFFGFDPLSLPTDWSKTTMNINGINTEKYWAKFEITSDITTDPLIEQIKLHTNSFEIESDGFTSYRGTSRYAKSIPIIIEANGDKTPLNEDIKIANGMTIVRLHNEFADVKVDGNILSGIIPEGLDTSIPVSLYVDWYPSNNNTGDVELEVELVPVTNNFVFDGTAQKLPTAPAIHTVSNDQEIKHTSVFQAIVQQSLPGDQVFASLFRDATAGNTDDTYVGNIVITNIVLVGHFWK